MNETAEQLHAVAELLSDYRFTASTEQSLQEGIEEVLRGNVLYERECILSPRDRIDFLVANGIGIECKVDGSQIEVIRQLQRYAEHDRIEALVLVTTKARHQVPAVVSGKPVAVVGLWRVGLW